MKNNTIRGRLLVWFVISTIATYTLLGLLVGLVIWNVLHDQIDHHLHTVITEAHQTVTTYPDTNQQLLQTLASQQGMTVAILDQSGQALIQTNSPDVARLSEPVMRQLMQETPAFTTIPIHFNINDIRFATLPVELGQGRGVLAIGYSLKIVEQTFRQLISIIALLLIITLGLVVYGIRHRLALYLKPLEEIALQTSQVTHSHTLSHRIVTSPATAELSALTDGINHMLDRLDRFFRTEHEFFSDAAHTLKTPLAILRSYIESTPKTAEQKESLKVLDSANDTIEDLLLLSRTQSHPGEAAPVSLTLLLTNLTEIIETLAKDKHIQVQTQLAPDIEVMGNHQLLNRAFANLLFNAVTYTPKNGSITIKLTANGQWAIVTISGVGNSHNSPLAIGC